MSATSGNTKEQAADVVDAAKQTAQQQAGEVTEKARGVLRRQVDQRSTQAGEQAVSVAETLRQTASQIRGEGDPQKARFASVADQGADRFERMGSYLTDADGEEILGRVEDMARQQPWLVAGAGLLAGIAAARFMKASSRERYYQRSRSYVQPQSVYAHRSVRPIGDGSPEESEPTAPVPRYEEVR